MRTLDKIDDNSVGDIGIIPLRSIPHRKRQVNES